MGELILPDDTHNCQFGEPPPGECHSFAGGLFVEETMSLDKLIEERNTQTLAGVHSVLLVDVCSVIYYIAFGRMDAYKREKDSIRLGKRIAAETAFFCRKAIKDFGLKACVLCFDSKFSLRRTIYPEYKSKRREKPLPDAERFVVDCVKDAATILRCNSHLLGFQQCVAFGYEADDCIAVHVNYLTPRVRRIIILSSDQDLYQCVNGNVWVARPVGGALIDALGVIEEFGVSPDKVAEFKALAGCKSDDVPGIAGIGEKYATDYLNGKPIPEKKRVLIECADKTGKLQQWRLLVTLPLKKFYGYPPPTVCYDPDLSLVKHHGWLEELAVGSGVNEDEFVSLSDSEETVPEPEPYVLKEK